MTFQSSVANSKQTKFVGTADRMLVAGEAAGKAPFDLWSAHDVPASDIKQADAATSLAELDRHREGWSGLASLNESDTGAYCPLVARDASAISDAERQRITAVMDFGRSLHRHRRW